MTREPIAGGQTVARHLFACACVAAVAFAPSPARADPLDDAKDLFARGRSLRQSGDCAGAVLEFRKALALYPAGLGSLRNIAECEESEGLFASARRAWLDLKRALVTEQDTKYDGWRQDAAAAAARLAPKVATLTVSVTEATPEGRPAAASGVEVTLDGEPIAAGLLETALDRDPGHYVVRAAGPGLVGPREQTVDLASGEAKRVQFHVTAASPEAPASPSPALLPPAAPSPSSPPMPGALVSSEPVAGVPASSHATTIERRAGWIALGAGAAAFLGAGISAGVRQSAIGRLDVACDKQGGAEFHCSAADQSSLDAVVDRGRAASTIADVLVVAGAIGTAGGAALLALGYAPPRVAWVILPVGVAIAGEF